METTLSFIIFLHVLDVGAIIISGFFLFKLLMQDIRHEQNEFEMTDADKRDEAYNNFKMHLQRIQHKFWISFAVLEISIILFFMFWGWMLYNNVRII